MLSFSDTLQILVGCCLQRMQEIILLSITSLQQGVQSERCPHGSHTISEGLSVHTRHYGYLLLNMGTLESLTSLPNQFSDSL